MSNKRHSFSNKSSLCEDDDVSFYALINSQEPVKNSKLNKVKNLVNKLSSLSGKEARMKTSLTTKKKPVT